MRYALRQLRLNPGFAAAAILTLALGIGANTGIFQVLDTLLFRPLSVLHPEQLVQVGLLEDSRPRTFTYSAYRELATRQDVAGGILATSDFPLHAAVLRGRGPARTVNGVLVSANYFDVLGVPAHLGRTFAPGDLATAVISDSFWRREFGGSADTIGQPLYLNKSVVTVIGVAPPEFFGEKPGNAPDLWVPLEAAPQLLATDWLNAPKGTWLTLMARLRPGVSARQAEAALGTLYGRIAPSPARIHITPGERGIVDLQHRFEQPVLLLMGGVGLLLLIACCNLASLLLGRAASRTHEIGVRLALGAGRPRVVRQLLLESAVLAGFGSLGALALAAWVSRGLAALAAASAVLPLGWNWRVLAFTAAIAVLATVFCGLAPALSATRVELHAALQGSRAGAGRRRQTLGKALVAAQVAVSLLLLAGAGLLGRSLWNLRHQDFGFRGEGVLMADLPWEFSPAMMARYAVLGPRILERVRAVPGVESAALSCFGPMGGDQHTGPLSAPGLPAQPADRTRIVHVSPRYFETLGMRLVAGRPLSEDDRAGSPKVAVLSETAARTLFGTTSAAGRLVSQDGTYDARHAIEVVGVVRDVRFAGAADPFGSLLYVPVAQSPAPITAVFVRVAGEPAAAATAVRAALQQADPDLAVSALRPLTDKIDAGLGQERTVSLVAASFGLLALILTCVGVYGVISYAVARRTREIGIRMALGATGPEVSRMLLREMAPPVAASMAFGAAGALFLARGMRHLLFGIAAYDYPTLLAAGAVLALVAAAAGYVPARRAARLDPMRALRQ